MLILVDNREYRTAPEVIKGLNEFEPEIKSVNLSKIGDYILSENLAVERKTSNDFISTVTRGGLFTQLFDIKKYYEKTFLLVEGNFISALNKRNRFNLKKEWKPINESAIYGAICTTMRCGIPVIFAKDESQTALYLYMLAKQEIEAGVKKPFVRTVDKGKVIAECQENGICCIPGMGVKKAQEILNKYGDLGKAWANVENWSNDIKGIGGKLLEKSLEIRDSIYNNCWQDEKLPF